MSDCKFPFPIGSKIVLRDDAPQDSAGFPPNMVFTVKDFRYSEDRVVMVEKDALGSTRNGWSTRFFKQATCLDDIYSS